jgi:hypothetical protein
LRPTRWRKPIEREVNKLGDRLSAHGGLARRQIFASRRHAIQDFQPIWQSACGSWQKDAKMPENKCEHFIERVRPGRTHGPVCTANIVSEADLGGSACCFVEEFTCHCLRRRLPTGLDITEVALANRSPEAPERFQITLSDGGLQPWRIQFHASRFEQT